MAVSIVTGASRGIGAAVVRELAARGDTVIASGRDEERLAELAAGSPGSGRIEVHSLDLTQPGAAAELVAAAGKLGELTALVNAAGAIAAGPVEHTGPETWLDLFAVNLHAPVSLCREAIPALRAAGGGAIVNISSVAGTGGAPFAAAYGASKAALVNFTQALAAELAADAIRVCAVSPGLTETEMGQATLTGMAGAIGISADDLLGQLQGRWVDPGEIAGIVSWLTGPHATAVSGAHLIADLGQTTRLN